MIIIMLCKQLRFSYVLYWVEFVREKFANTQTNEFYLILIEIERWTPESIFALDR